MVLPASGCGFLTELFVETVLTVLTPAVVVGLGLLPTTEFARVETEEPEVELWLLIRLCGTGRFVAEALTPFAFGFAAAVAADLSTALRPSPILGPSLARAPAPC